MSAKSYLMPIAMTLIAGCHGSDKTKEEAEVTSQDAVPIKSGGGFYCHAGTPGRGYQVASSTEVAPGANATLTLDVPAWKTKSFTPASALVRCQVDLKWCDGASCRGRPPVDFYGEHSDGLTWEALTTDETQSAKFRAIAHNADTVSHTVRLVLELPNGWQPAAPDQQASKP